MTLADALHYDPAGLVPAVLQDGETREVLILAYMNREAVERTLATGLVHLWSRSRGKPWLKGESSGRLQRVVEVRPDCEMNSLLVLVEQALPGACHTGHSSCYYRRVAGEDLEELSPPLFDPASVYKSGAAGPLAELVAAYRWLRSRESVPESATWRALRGVGPDPADRLRQEWDELLGVFDGSHRHQAFEEDVRLEAYQVLYWTCLYQVLSGEDGQEQLAAASLVRGYESGADPADALRLAEQSEDAPGRLGGYWMALGAACARGGIAPREIVERDLTDLRSRPYMRPHLGLEPSAPVVP